ncbi:MAG: hypothetical protein BWY41_00147 [Candidatus Atribacteria bacterium ADurb.Bin276]|uniref:DNA utilization protein GntX n=1 Tax=Candidatus Atribacter allofermentans TaxID=1852833 RepID=A0A1V5T3Z2_9BACT|nr:MAG: hypothetical protein BWY41_00147 [Candidatus Atribacteria bacterium ADurb.Bin276]
MIFNILPLGLSKYNPDEKLGWLSDYYAYSKKLEMNFWRYNTYSSAILDYKAGKDHHLDFFVSPFISLIEEIIRIENIGKIILVPLPSSKPKFNKDYRITPNEDNDPKKNRDDRNLVFCEKVSKVREDWQSIELIERIKLKDSKNQRSIEQQLSTLSINSIEHITQNTTIILMDDVYTSGGTMKASKMLIKKSLGDIKMIGVVLGRTVIC